MNPFKKEFDPSAPEMLAAAAIAAAKAHATAIGAQKKIADLRGSDFDWSVLNAQPSPPVNLPALSSIEGSSHMQRARVVGYQIEHRTFCDLIAPNGARLQPGDEVFLEAHLANIYWAAYWNSAEGVQKRKLFAVAEFGFMGAWQKAVGLRQVKTGQQFSEAELRQAQAKCFERWQGLVRKGILYAQFIVDGQEVGPDVDSQPQAYPRQPG